MQLGRMFLPNCIFSFFESEVSSLRKYLHAYIKFIDKTNYWIGRFVSILLIPMVGITVYEVFGRYVIARPTIWAWDLNIYLFAGVILLGGGYTFLEGGHISVDVFSIHFSSRRKAIVDIITSFFFFFGLAIIIWYGFDLAWESWVRGETIPTRWAPPLWLHRVLIPIGAILIMLQGIAKVIRDFFVLFDQ